MLELCFRLCNLDVANQTSFQNYQKLCKTLVAYLKILFFSDAAKRNKPTSACTRKDVETALTKWFLGSGDPDGNRTIRVKKTSDK